VIWKHGEYEISMLVLWIIVDRVLDLKAALECHRTAGRRLYDGFLE